MCAAPRAPRAPRRWPKEYYNSAGQAIWDSLPSADKYKTFFSDSCDGHSSINQFFYDTTYGQVTFQGKDRQVREGGHQLMRTDTS